MIIPCASIGSGRLRFIILLKKEFIPDPIVFFPKNILVRPVLDASGATKRYALNTNLRQPRFKTKENALGDLLLFIVLYLIYLRSYIEPWCYVPSVPA